LHWSSGDGSDVKKLTASAGKSAAKKCLYKHRPFRANSKTTGKKSLNSCWEKNLKIQFKKHAGLFPFLCSQNKIGYGYPNTLCFLVFSLPTFSWKTESHG